MQQPSWTHPVLYSQTPPKPHPEFLPSLCPCFWPSQPGDSLNRSWEGMSRVQVVSPPPVPLRHPAQGVEEIRDVPAALSAGCSLVTPSRVPVPKHLPWRALTVKGSVLQEGWWRAGTLPTGQRCPPHRFTCSIFPAVALTPLPGVAPGNAASPGLSATW